MTERLRFVAARKAFMDARWDIALELLRGCEDWALEIAQSAVLIKADILMHRDPVAAIGYLTSTQDLVENDEVRFDREVLTGRAFANVRNYGAAEIRFDRAAVLRRSVRSGAPLAYQSARLRWFRRELTLEDPDLAEALADRDPNYQALALLLRSWVRAALDDYSGQIADLRAALGSYANAGAEKDIYGIATVVHVLARVSFELGDRDGIAAARAAYDGIRWTDDVRVERFQSLRALGYDAFMHGESARAQWLFRDAATCAPSGAWRVFAHLDRAYVARVGDNEAWALDEISEAAALARGVAWGETFGEERMALVALATLLAPTDIVEAQRYAATYSRLGTSNVMPYFAITADRRSAGFEQYAQGRIEQMLGQTGAAENALRKAYGVFSTIDHQYRSLIAARALAEVTDDPIWTERASRHAQRYPGSPFAEKLGGGAAQPTVWDAFSPLTRQIARAHIAGDDVETLAQRFGRSRETVERSLHDIYLAFGVASRDALRSEATRRGFR